MTASRTPLTRVEFQILLAVLGGSTHGYAIMKDVEALTNGGLRIGPGTLYTAIKRLLDAGLIEEYDADHERRRCYRVTRRGRNVGTEEARELSVLLTTARKRGLLPSPS
jgi:DNA-binding PadR family transcriptional regulator